MSNEGAPEGPKLVYSTGNARTDAMLRGAVGIFEAAFPGRIRGYYLFGSHMDGSAVGISDLDIFVVFKDDFLDEQEAERARRLWHACSHLSAVQCDLLSFSERHLFTEGHFRLKSASILIYGEDVRERMPLLSLDTYLHVYAHAPTACMSQVLRRTDTLVYPLHYPDPFGSFYGYEYHDARMSKNGGRSIKGWVNTVCWIATIIVAFQSGRMIGTKAESVRAYRESVGDHWAAFVEAVYTNGKTAWGYQVPGDPVERALLRDLCQKTLAFENHSLALYRLYLLQQLRQADETCVRFAVERLGMVRYLDAEVTDALHEIVASGPADLRNATRQTLRHIDPEKEKQARYRPLA